MPEGNRYALKDKFRHKDKVLEILEKNKIKVIDIDKNIFDKYDDPLDLFNEMKIYYNEVAYKLIANYLVK